MEVTHVQIEVLVPIQAQELFGCAFATRRLRGFRRRRPAIPERLRP